MWQSCNGYPGNGNGNVNGGLLMGLLLLTLLVIFGWYIFKDYDQGNTGSDKWSIPWSNGWGMTKGGFANFGSSPPLFYGSNHMPLPTGQQSRPPFR